MGTAKSNRLRLWLRLCNKEIEMIRHYHFTIRNTVGYGAIHVVWNLEAARAEPDL